jgi:acyl transferase domain-containing protein
MNASINPRSTASNGELLVFSAASRGSLIEKLTEISSQQVPSLAELALRLAELPAESHRVALIANDPADLTAKAANAASRLASSDKARFNFANQIFYGQIENGAPLQKVAFLFPGFGARHATLMEDLYQFFPSVREWFDGLEGEYRSRLLENSLLFPSLIKASESPARRPDFADTIDAVLVMNLAMYKLFAAHLPDLRCNAMLGHSYGENAMLLASGMVKDYRQIINLPGQIIRVIQGLDRETIRAATDVVMLAVTASSRRTLEDLRTDHSTSVMIALDNCPQQAILCGKNDDLVKIEKILKERGDICFRIPELTIPVHTPFFPVPVTVLEQIYSRIDLTAPAVRAYSCAIASPFPPQPEAIRSLLVSQWSTPVGFRETIEKLYSDGIRTFIEVGPGGHLTGFTRDILRGSDALAIATNIEGKDTLSQLRVFLGQLFVRGYSIDLKPFQVNHLQTPPVPTHSASLSTSARPSKDRHQAITYDVLQQVALTLELDDPDLIDPHQGFFEMGMNSIQAVELVEKLQTKLGRRLAQTLPFDYPSVEKLVDFLSGTHLAVAAANASSVNDIESYSDGVAIIGIGCRLPGNASSPAAFWELLRHGRDAITEIPPDRWNFDEIESQGYDVRSLSHIRRGGFLNKIDEFDCAFFGISPREALTLDPQQRLLLEVTWEALENAAVNPHKLKKTSTGVFIGISNNDYAQRLTMRQRLAINGYLGTGNSHSTAAGRISFILGLTGPCLAVDTACSSSLVALHLASRSLRFKESDIAIAGGVNLLVSPETSIYLSMAGALSKDSHCKTFDAAADGYVRSEGCGVVVLKRLRDALDAGDRVLAVIRGSAINHDGHTSGFTVPHGPSQQAVIQLALADAGVTAAEVSYLEAHGTGTSLGDPIEVHALEQVFAQAQSAANPVLLGSVKSNIGHLEASAGIASLIKVVLQLQHRQIAPSLHFKTPNPKIDWKKLPLAVCNEITDWNASERLLTAGVSSFGISGTNAHVIVQESPQDREASGALRPHHILTLSARSEPAVDAMVDSYSSLLSDNSASKIGNVCYTSNVGRAHFQHRVAVVASSSEEAVGKLERRPTSSLVKRAKLAFLFSGQGSQYSGMGRQLFESEPIFREAIEHCNELLLPYLDTPLIEALFQKPSLNGESCLLDQTAYTQPALFSLEYALARLWKSWGIEPDVVIGHSVGEYVAACIAGVFSLEEGINLIAARGKLMQALPSGGAMLAVRASESEVRNQLDFHEINVSIAAVNGEQNVVLSGPNHAVDTARKTLNSNGIVCKQLKVSHAFHSFLMDPVLDEFKGFAAKLTYHPSQIPLISNLTGRRADNEILSAEYWANQLRQTVKFGDGLRALLDEGCNTFLEIGPKPVLIGMAEEALQNLGHTWLASLQPPADDLQRMLESLAMLYVEGAEVNWESFHAGRRGQKAGLPNYPFQRERFWIEPETVDEQPQSYRSSAKRTESLLGNCLSLPDLDEQVRFESHVSTAAYPFLEDYRIFGRNSMPISGFIAMLERAGKSLYPSRGISVKGFTLHEPLFLNISNPAAIQTVLNPTKDGGYRCRIFSLRAGGYGIRPSWSLHAESEVREIKRREGVRNDDLNRFHNDPKRSNNGRFVSYERDRFYSLCKQIGFDYGARFQVLADLQVDDEQALGTLELPRALADEVNEYLLHPAMLDGCFQALGAVLMRNEAIHTVRSIERLTIHRGATLGPHSLVSCEVRSRSEDAIHAAVTLIDQDSGDIIIEMEGIRCTMLQADLARSHSAPTLAPVSRIVQKLRAASEMKREEMLGDYLHKTLATILGVSRAQALSRDLSFNQTGLDSLMALHLRNELQVDFGFEISVAKLTDDQTLAGLTASILRHLFSSDEIAMPASEEAPKIDWVEGEL